MIGLEYLVTSTVQNSPNQFNSESDKYKSVVERNSDEKKTIFFNPILMEYSSMFKKQI